MAERSNRSQKRCCQWLFWLFLTLLILIPLPFGSNRPWAWGGMELWIFLLTGFGAIWAGIKEENLIPTDGRIPFFFMFLWFLYPLWQVLPFSESALSLLSPTTLSIRRLAGFQELFGPISLDLALTWQAWLKGMAYFGGFWFTYAYANSSLRMMQLAVVLFGSGAFQAIYGLLMVRSDTYGTVSGTFINRNHLAGFLELTLPMGLGLMIGWMAPKQDTPLKMRDIVIDWLLAALGRKGILFLLLVIMLLAAFLTQSRAGNASLLLSLMVVTAISGFRIGGIAASREKRLLMPLIAISILVGTWYGLDHLTGRLLNTHFGQDGRWLISVNSVDMLKEFQLFGCGAGTFGIVYPLYRKGELSEEFLDHAHNDHVELLVEQGVVGYGLLCVAFVSCWLFIMRGYLYRRDPLMRGVLFASLTGTLSLTLHALFDFNFQIPSNALYFMVLLGMGMRCAVLPAHAKES